VKEWKSEELLMEQRGEVLERTTAADDISENS
jgi:hypothetical protein